MRAWQTDNDLDTSTNIRSPFKYHQAGCAPGRMPLVCRTVPSLYGGCPRSVVLLCCDFFCQVGQPGSTHPFLVIGGRIGSPGGMPLFERPLRPICGGCQGNVVFLSCNSVWVVGPAGETHPPLVSDGYSRYTCATVGSPVTLPLPSAAQVNPRCLQ